MPKDEFDFEDPLELNGVAFLTEDDTSAEMTECFAEEFMRMGYNHKQVLALFRNPHYVGPNMVLANKGEPFVRNIIAETFAKWGKPVFWTESQPVQSALSPHPGSTAVELSARKGATRSSPNLNHNRNLLSALEIKSTIKSKKCEGDLDSTAAHPGALPQGEGEAATAGSPTQRASTLPAAVELPFPLPEGDGQGEGERRVLQSGDCGARGCASSPSAQQNAELDDPLTDPMGNLIPKLR